MGLVAGRALAAADDPEISPAQEAQLLRNAVRRADAVLSDPPQLFARCPSVWRRFAGADAAARVDGSQRLLRENLETCAAERSKSKLLRFPELEQLALAINAAEAAVGDARAAAVSSASAVPWGDAITKPLVRAVGGPAEPAEPAVALGGKVVGVYFSASWCGPCRGFSPALVELYDRSRRLFGNSEVGSPNR